MTNKNENQETYYFYDKNFVEALSNPENVKDGKDKEIQLEFEKTKDENGKQCWKLVSDKSVIKEVNKLDLYEEEIKNIKGISNFSDLKELCLFYNKIKEIPSEIGKLENLEYLYLSNNQIKEIPEEIGKLKKLKKLYLSNNQIKKIPSEIGNLTNFGVLNFSYNQIEELPSEIGELKQLKILNLSGNQIKKISKEIWDLTNLECLYLSFNQIKELPSEICNLKNLKELYLDNNKSLGKLAENYSSYQNNVYKNKIRKDKGFKIGVNSSGIRINKIDK